MTVKRYKVRLYNWTTTKKWVERTLDPTDAGILKETLEALVKEVTGKNNPVLDHWWIRVYALNGVRVATCKLDAVGRPVVTK